MHGFQILHDMRIGMIVNNLNTSGGYQKLILRLSEELQRSGNDVVIYALSVDKNRCYPDLIKNQTVIDAGYQLDKYRIGRFFDIVFKYFYYRKLSQTIDGTTEILLLHDDQSLDILSFYRGHKTKIFWMLNNQFPDYLISPRALKVNMSYSTRGMFFYIRDAIDNFIKNIRRKHLADIRCFLTYDIFNAELVKKAITAPVAVVYAGADTKEWDGKRIFQQNSKKISLLSIGVVFPHRRYEDILEAVLLLKKSGYNPHLKILGSYDLSPEYFSFLQAFVKKFKMSAEVEFLGSVDDETIDRAYQESDIFLFVNDGFTWGISVFEAMGFQLPIIVTNNIGAVDLFHDSKSCWTVPPRSPQAIADAVADIIDNPSHTEKNVKKYPEILAKVSWEAYADRMLDAFRKN